MLVIHIISKEDIKILSLLGYCVTYDSTDTFYPIYYISWKY